jgi:hypothetical protein
MNLLRISDIGFSIEEFARFRSQIEQGPGCWEWTGEKNSKGYGRFTIYRDGKRVRLLAHRLALALMLGREPIGSRHSCDNPPCCRDDHLLEGTQTENMRDAVERGRLDRSGLDAYRAARDWKIAARLAAGVKRCRGCNKVKPFSEFSLNRSLADGHQGECKSCHAVRHQARRIRERGVTTR